MLNGKFRMSKKTPVFSRLCIYITVSLIVIIPAASIRAMGSYVKLQPAAVKKPKITQMEYQKYAVINGGEITGYAYFVYKLNRGGNTMDLYVGTCSNKFSEITLKSVYFSDRFSFDLEKGTMLHFTENWSNTIFSGKTHGIFYIETTFDYRNLEADSRIMSWDGKEIKSQKSRLPIKAGYSYFCGLEIYPAILRLLDPEKPGIIYLTAPGFLNLSLPGYFRVVGKEEITTPAGKFKAVKVNFMIADNFLGNLMKGYTDHFIMWVDTATGVTVKNQYTDSSTIVLAESGVWKGGIR